MSITELVYKTHDNENKVTIASSDTGTPLAGVTRITVELDLAAVTIDSDTSPDSLSWTDTQITFMLGGVVAKGLQKAAVTVYSETYPGGQIIVHPRGPDAARLFFMFIDA